MGTLFLIWIPEEKMSQNISSQPADLFTNHSNGPKEKQAAEPGGLSGLGYLAIM